MDVASLVRSITASFEDATVLVKRIQDQQNSTPDSLFNHAAIAELLESLYLGPIVVKGYYNADAKRFGEQYTIGDSTAREQLKDVLIHLQMTVLTTLRLVLVDDQGLDYASIQCASDDCRVNTGVSLGQLSQRLADPSRAHQFSREVASFPFQLPDPGLKYAQSVSSQSSDGPRTPTTPELEKMMEDFDYPGRLPGFNPHASNLRGKALAVLQGTSQSPSRPRVVRRADSSESWTTRTDEASEAEYRRPSSTTLSASDQPVFSPVSPASPGNRDTDSPVSTRGIITGRSTAENLSSRERYGPDDYLDVHNHYVNFSHPSRSANVAHQSTSPRRPSEQPRVPYRPSHPSHVSVSSTRSAGSGSGSITQLQHANRSTISVNAPIPVSPEDPAPPVPAKSVARKASNEGQLPPGARKILGDDVDIHMDRFVNEPNMPTEKNLMGYCKGAQRLQSGSEKKPAFTAAQRPVGFSGFIPFWKCEKCHFEGPMKTSRSSSMSKAKPEKIFDPAVREYNGIRFRWAFLAKCHVPLKNQPHRPDGSAGSFGCIFCTAEAKSRQWVVGQQTPDGRPSDIGFLPSDSTPIFGNSSSFMDHLQMHRQRDYWPNKEVQRRMKCVVGRVAAAEEDFEINFMPLDAAPPSELY